MNNLFQKTLVSIGCLFLMACIAVCSIGSCSNKNSKQASTQNTAKTDSRFFYEDSRGVFHADKNCIVLTLGGLRAHEDGDAVYSVTYHKKEHVKDWYFFAAANQLCTHCFNEEVLEKFEEERLHADSTAGLFN